MLCARAVDEFPTLLPVFGDVYLGWAVLVAPGELHDYGSCGHDGQREAVGRSFFDDNARIGNRDEDFALVLAMT